MLFRSRDAVCALLAKLFEDPRHKGVTILLFEEISERQFGNWTMGRVNLDSVNPALLLKYSETTELKPFDGSGRAIMTLLLDLLSTGAIISRPGG